MRSFLEKEAAGLVQYLPFRLRRPDGTGNVQGYFVGQILRLVDCLDRERTEVRLNWEPVNEFGDFDTYRPLVIKESMLGNERLFRLKGASRTIVMREDLKDAMAIAGFAGHRFDLLEKG